MFKIDCDSLTDADLVALATEIYVRTRTFSRVFGVPRGGFRLAEALRRYQVPEDPHVLVVDDVLTTGRSITTERERRAREFPDCTVMGAVLFARGDWPAWAMPLFVMAGTRRRDDA